ncbi:hypothetical protein HDV00_011456 [Rhizophlyctis rosea]|nr:hypothetical protein HDV00_011456 [Rhizophlyctis rosea]
MGSCLAQTQQLCCPNWPWAANSFGRGLPTQPTFDYDEIDDLEFDTLLNDPHLGYGHGIGGRPSSRAGLMWHRFASLFRLNGRAGAGGPGGSGVGGLLGGSGGVRGGYQAVPGFPPPQRGFQGPGRGDFEDDDAFFGANDEDAELMDNDQINRITSLANSQKLKQQTGTTSSPPRDSNLVDIAPERVQPFADPTTASLSSAASYSSQNSGIPAARAMNTFTTFRPKSRSSSTSNTSAAVAASSFAYTDAPEEQHENAWAQSPVDDDDGFGHYQTAAQTAAEPQPEPPADPTPKPSSDAASGPPVVDDAPAVPNSKEQADESDLAESDPLQASFNPQLLSRLSSISREDFV